LKLFIDFETKSLADLKTVGTVKYANDPSTEIIMLGWVAEDGREGLWVPGEEIPKVFNTATSFIAHNMFFDYTIWNILSPFKPLKIDQIECTYAICNYHNISASLKDACRLLNLYSKKQEVDILAKFSMPDKTTGLIPKMSPVDFKNMREYCLQDVRTARELYDTLGALPPTELEVWRATFAMNEIGVAIDEDLVEKGVIIKDAVAPKLTDVFLNMCGYRPTQSAKLLQWVNDKGIKTKSLGRSAREVILEGNIPSDIRKTLELLDFTSSRAVDKYGNAKNRVYKGRVHDNLIYHAAITGRMSSKGLQVQNMARNGKNIHSDIEYLKNTKGDYTPEDLLKASSCSRGMVVPKTGYIFAQADYNAIEARVTAWFANEKSMLDTFAHGDCVYCAMASVIFNKPIKKIKDQEDPPERQLGKAAVLGLGFGAGYAKFYGTFYRGKNKATREQLDTIVGDDYDYLRSEIERGEALDDFCVQFNEKPEDIIDDLVLCKKIVNIYRNTNENIRVMWKKCEDAWIYAVANPGRVYSVRGVPFVKDGDFLKITLPSGRILHFYKPDKLTYLSFGGEGLKTKISKPVTKTVYSSLIFQNIVQAIARDITMTALIQITKSENFKPVLVVHDEIISETAPGADLQEYSDLMLPKSDWAATIPVIVTAKFMERYSK
jgi:DNA polymerase